jgi:1,4-dihydroxy-2-naphthoate octaprenyltransferase
MKRWILIGLLWPAGIIVLIAVGFLGHSLLDHQGYRDFVTSAAHIGWFILLAAVTMLVADIAVMVVYTIRHGQSDDQAGKVVTDDSVIGSLDRTPGISKRKILGSKSGFVTMESLVEGTATRGERMMALGISTAMVSFFLIFVGAGLMLMKDALIFILFPIGPGIILYNFAADAGGDYRKAKRKAAARRRGERGNAEENHEPHGDTFKHA